MDSRSTYPNCQSISLILFVFDHNIDINDNSKPYPSEFSPCALSHRAESHSCLPCIAPDTHSHRPI